MNTPAEINNRIMIEQERYPKELQTTEFWMHASKKLSKILDENRLHNFRREDACLAFFVPTYGIPGNGLTQKQVDQVQDFFADASYKQQAQISNLMSGYEAAKADYRLIEGVQFAANIDAFKEFSESNVGNPIEQFSFNGKTVSRASQNYLLGLLYLLLNAPDAKLEKVIEIGGGFGVLGEILAQSSYPFKTYINFDIAPTCVFADYYLQEACPAVCRGYMETNWNHTENIDNLSGLYVRPNHEIVKLDGSADLVVNFHSFQEMEPETVKAYISKINEWKPKYLLLRNIREGKQKKSDGKVGVLNPISSDDYLCWLTEYKLINSSSLVFGHTTSDKFHSELMILKKKNS